MMSVMEMLTSTLSTMTTVLGVVALYLVGRWLLSKRYRLPPGPRGLPLIGNYLTLVSYKGGQQALLNDWAAKYGDIFTFTVLGTRFVMLNSYQLVKEAFKSADINDRAPILPCNKALKRPNTGNGVVTRCEGHAWLEMRRFVHTAMRNARRSSHDFEDLVVTEVDKIVQVIANLQGTPFDPSTHLYVAVSNVTTNILTGRTYGYEDAEFVELTQLAKDVFDWMGPGSFSYHVPLLAHLPTAMNRKGERSIAAMFQFVEKVVAEHRRAFDSEAEPRNLVDSFLREQWKRKLQGADVGFYDDQCLLQLVWDLILGGFETVSSSLCWYLLLMAQYPDIQAKVQTELDKVVGRERRPGLADRDRLPFTEAVIIESYRISRVLPTHIPKRTRCNVRLGGYDIPRGTYLATNAHVLSSSPAIWKEADEFRPERFIDSHTGKFNAKLEATLAEFGSGRRACPGEQLARTELFITFTHIMHGFTVRLPEGTPRSMAGIGGLTFHPVAYKITATPR